MNATRGSANGATNASTHPACGRQSSSVNTTTSVSSVVMATLRATDRPGVSERTQRTPASAATAFVRPSTLAESTTSTSTPAGMTSLKASSAWANASARSRLAMVTAMVGIGGWSCAIGAG